MRLHRMGGSQQPVCSRHRRHGRARVAFGRVRALSLAAVAAACVALGAGCASPIALDRAVMAYDATTADSVSKQLLLNIARARLNEPMHFTAISNIAATYRFGVSAGVVPALTGDRGALLLPVLGSAAEENPTISISPMQGEEFTQRLLTPFPEQKLTLLLRQGYDVDALLRLMGSEVLLQGEGSTEMTVHHNRPSDREGYQIYRRIVAHLSAIQDRQHLHVEPLHFLYTWNVPAEAVTPETYNDLYKEFSLTLDPDGKVYHVSKRVNGRVMITNYDPAVLSNEELLRLHEEAEEAPFNDVLIDIRPEFVGGAMPVHGRLRLRSFHEILTFIARGMEEEPEYDVAPDPRTGSIRDNPIHTLEIVEAKSAPPGHNLFVQLNGRFYAVRAENGYQWNRKVFSLLYQLFQMSVSTVVQTGPAITIAK
jgi:hypothetical protein